MARPPKNGEVLDGRLAFRLPSAVADEWKQAAESKGVSLSDWLREQVDGDDVETIATGKKTPVRVIRRPAPKADPALVTGVAKIGNNLNQMARALNECRLIGDAVQLVEVAAQLAAIRADLLSLLPLPRSGKGGGDAD